MPHIARALQIGRIIINLTDLVEADFGFQTGQEAAWGSEDRYVKVGGGGMADGFTFNASQNRIYWIGSRTARTDCIFSTTRSCNLGGSTSVLLPVSGQCVAAYFQDTIDTCITEGARTGYLRHIFRPGDKPTTITGPGSLIMPPQVAVIPKSWARQTQWQRQRAGARGYRAPDVQVDGLGGFRGHTDTPPIAPTRPRRGIRDSKASPLNRVAAAMLRGINFTTEATDILDVVFEASGGPFEGGPIKKFEWLFLEGGIANLDYQALIRGLLLNEIEDRFYGFLGSNAGDFYRQFGWGLSRGPAV